MTGLFGDWRAGASSLEVMRGQSDAMRNEIDAAPPDHVLQADAEEWAEALADRYAIDLPGGDRERVTRDPPSQISHRPYGYGSIAVPGVRHVVRLPFSGEADVFKYRPSRRLMGEIPGKVVGDTLVLELDSPESAPVDLGREVGRWLDHIDDHLGYWATDVQGFEERLRVVALERIEERKRHQERIRTAAESSGIPIAGPKGKTYIPHTIVRKPGRVRRSRSNERSRIPLDPSLGDAVYEEIIESLRRGCRQMETTPAPYLKMDEQERRDVLLVPLNDGFTGVSGEAFNAAGKTDILVPFENGNLFIGECKNWGGKEGFTDGIGQLFGYRTWRDSKLALVVFVPQKGLTSVIKTARSTLEAIGEFAGWIDHPHETELRCKVTWPGDPEKVGTLTIIFAHIPQ
jgi:hypothetical protein